MKTMLVAALFVAFTVVCCFSGVAEVVTEFSGNGMWNDQTLWSKGLPTTDSDNSAKITGNSTVDADGLDVSFHQLLLSPNAADSVMYRQTGGSFQSGYLLEVGNKGRASIELENVVADFSDFRLVVGRSSTPLARFAMRGGTLKHNLTASNAGVLLGINQTGGLSEIVLSNTIWQADKGDVEVGYSNMGTSRVDIVGGRFDSKVQVLVGGRAPDSFDDRVAEMSVANAASTNAANVRIARNKNTSGSLFVSNSSFRVSGSAQMRVGEGAGAVGSVTLAECPELVFDNEIQLAAGDDSKARLILKNQTDAASVIGKVSCRGGSGSEAWIELVNSPWSPGNAVWNIGTNAAQKIGFAFRDTTFMFQKKIAVAHGGTGHLVFSNATITASGGSIYGSDSASSTGVVEFVDSSLSHPTDFFLSDNTSGCGRLRISGGTANFDNLLQAPRQGYGETVIDGGAVVTVHRLYVGNLTGSTGVLKVSDESTILTITNRMYVGSNQNSSTGRVEQTGGTIHYDGDTVDQAFWIGCRDGANGYYRISGGKLIVDSSTYAINLGCASGGSGTMELAGGEVTAMRFYNDGNGSGNIIFDGGTYKVYPSNQGVVISGNLATEIREGGAVIDVGTDLGTTVKFIDTVLARDTSGGAAKDGGIVKKGLGTLKIRATPTFTGDVIVESGTLDISETSFVLGGDAVIGGGGTLIPPSGGITVTGCFILDPADASTLTVSGDVTIGPGAKILATNADLLDDKAKYVLFTANSSAGVPELAGFPAGWEAMNRGGRLIVCKHRGFALIIR